MNHPLVTFTSRYGSTRRYAHALAETLDTRAVDLASMGDAASADPLIVLAPQYVTTILGRRRIIRAIRSAPGRTALVVVALSPADDPGRGALAQKLVAATGHRPRGHGLPVARGPRPGPAAVVGSGAHGRAT